MKALTLKQIKTPLSWEEHPLPEPGHDEVVVKLHSAALNRRDYWITQGLYPGIEPPVILGSDGAGEVVVVGDEVQEDWLGRAVVLNPSLSWGSDQRVQSGEFEILGLPKDGTFATEVVVSASQLHAKPAHLDWHQAAALPLAGLTAYRAVFSQGNLQEGETMLVSGIGGGAAMFALQFGLARGADVWVTSSSDDKIRRAVELGASGGFNYKQDGWVKALVAQTEPPNLIIDSAGGPGYASLLSLAAPGGRIVSYGATAGPPQKLDLFKVFWKQLTLQGTTMGSPDDFEAMLGLINEHGIVPIVDEVFPIEDGNTAIERMATSPQFGKYVLQVRNEA